MRKKQIMSERARRRRRHQRLRGQERRGCTHGGEGKLSAESSALRFCFSASPRVPLQI